MVLTLFGNINISSAQTTPDFKGIFSHTALEMEKPCMRYVVLCTGLLYEKMLGGLRFVVRFGFWRCSGFLTPKPLKLLLFDLA
jgi:hypothetical protein